MGVPFTDEMEPALELVADLALLELKVGFKGNPGTMVGLLRECGHPYGDPAGFNVGKEHTPTLGLRWLQLLMVK